MRVASLAGVVLVGLLPAVLTAQEAPAAGDIPFEAYTLDNGLQVLLAPDPGATAVAVNLWYDVGSRHERPGRSGFGHLFEHLMFQGSAGVERGEHMQLVERAGGSMNASITEDRTNYFQTMPPDRYNLALWLESDRMRSLGITEENMRREIEVVKEERRLGVDNNPYGSSFQQALYYAAYDSTSCFPYAHSVIGSMEDLDAAELADVQAFFDAYYGPDNATLALVGAFDPDEARGLVEEYFAGIPASASPAPAECSDPFRHLPTERTIDDPNANLPAVILSYGTVPAVHPDSPALTLLASILGAGETSRLHRRLVREERAALQAQTFAMRRLDPGLVVVLAIANQGVETGRLQALLEEEIERIQQEGVPEEELARVRTRYRASTIMGRQTVMGRAEALQWHNHFLGDAGAIRTELARFQEVTPEQVREVAVRYLRPDNRAVVITRPATANQGDGR